MDVAAFDSCILIDQVEGVAQAPSIISQPRQRYISVIAEIELLTGVRNAAERANAERLLELFTIIEVDRNLGALAVDIRQKYRLKTADALIYATAQRLRLPLITRNTKDFPPDMPGVIVPYQL
jgi:predicted nucleic acid-binding protein